jgi:hypothetical protein
MSYVAKLVSNNTPKDLTFEQKNTKFDALINDSDFIGLKPGEPVYVLYSTEQAALACVAREQSDSKVSTFLVSAEVVTLESLGFDLSEFSDRQAIIGMKNTINNV